MSPSRIFLFALAAFIAGVGIGSFGTVPYAVLAVAASGGATILALGALRKNTVAIAAGLAIVMCVGGVVRLDLGRRVAPDLEPFFGASVTVRGTVAAEPERGEKSQRVRIGVYSIDGTALVRPVTTLITARRYPAYAIGDEIEVMGRLEAPENYGEFDYVSYLAKENIFSVMPFPEIRKIGERKGNRITLALADVKRSFEGSIERALPEPYAAFMQGLLLGERDALPPDLEEQFRRTGVTHIIALSGYNITLVGNFFIAFLLALTVPFRISFWIAVLGISLFVVMTGASPSVVRAGIMGILVLVAYREGRLYRMTNALVFAAAAMIFVNPEILRFDIAFQLSFCATLGLMHFSPAIDAFVGRIAFRVRRLWSPAAIDPRFARPDAARKPSVVRRIFSETVGAQIAVLPILTAAFGSVSVVSPLSNLLVLLAVPYAMAAGFVAGLAGYVSDAAAFMAGVPAWVLLEYQLRVVEVFSAVPFAAVSVPQETVYIFTVFVGAAFAAALKSRGKKM